MRKAGIGGARRSMVAVVLGLALVALVPGTAAAQRVPGIDVSRFQEAIDWDRVGETSIGFAFVQASRGSGRDCTVVPDRCGADEFYRLNHLGARAEGIRVGAYHRAFASGRGPKSARKDAKVEADVFIQQVGALRQGDLLPALDVESPFGDLSRRGLRAWVRKWLQRVRRKLGARPIIYTNSSSWQATGDTTKFARKGHPLWVANYGVESPSVPADNWNGAGWSVWQYTSSGHVKGIDGSVDKNRLRVGLEEISVP